METLEKLNPIRRDIEHFFSFLFEMGYSFRYTDFNGRGMLLWEVVFESSECLIHIFKERSDIFLVFAPLNAISMNNDIRINDEIAIEPMIYYVSKGEKFIGLFEANIYRNRKKLLGALADLLKEYIDQITPYFENYKFRLCQNDLLAAQREYNNLLVKRYVKQDQTGPF
jgi:hypothetical protein